MRTSWTLRMASTALVLAGCVGDSEPPELMEMSPAADTEYRGVGRISVHAIYRDDSHVTPRLFVDAIHVDTQEARCNESSCTVEFLWATDAFDAGAHDLTLVLEDDSGNVTTETRPLWIDDVLEIVDLRVTNIVDESGSLEIEVYAFDETNALIGCAGSRHGLGVVDDADTSYAPGAILINTSSLALATRDMGSRTFRLEVWEDDDGPVCPIYPDASGNDRLGTSPSLTTEQWRTAGKLMFGNVTFLAAAWSRRLSETSVVDTDPYDPWFDGSDGAGGAGCTGGVGPVQLYWLLTFAWLRRRKRTA